MLFKSHPLLAINFCLILFSIAGIPPLVGFYSKLFRPLTASLRARTLTSVVSGSNIMLLSPME